MTGVSGDLRATTAHVRRGTVSESYARSQVERGERWLDGLGARRHLAAYQEEVHAVQEAVLELREAMRERWSRVIRLLWVPERKTGKSVALTQAEVGANILASQDPRTKDGTADPGYIRPRPLLKPSVEVLWHDNGYIRQGGRARVADAYQLLIGGLRILTGSKRYVMRQADWAVKLDEMGKMPFREALFTSGMTHHQRSHHLYQLRKEKRPKGRLRKRSAPRRRPNVWKGRHGDRQLKADLRRRSRAAVLAVVLANNERNRAAGVPEVMGYDEGMVVMPPGWKP